MRTILIAFLLCFLLHVVAGQEATETPIPQERPIESIFSNDTCAPPCWFGLIPGESTGQEALDLLISSEYVEDVLMFQHDELLLVPDGAEAIEDGRYNFNFGPFENYLCCVIYSYVLIHEGLLDKIYVLVRENITLGEVIENIGWPDEIRLSAAFAYVEHPNFYFTFIYYEPYTKIFLSTEEFHTREVRCNYFSTQDNFLVSGAEYYSLRNAMELVSVRVPQGEPEQYQPRFLAYEGEEKYIPPDLWPILMGDTAYLCEDLWNILPE